MADEVEERIVQILVASIVPDANRALLTPGTPLVEGGLDLDSVSLFELIVSVEEAFGVTVEDDELSYDLVATIGSVADFVRRKLQGSDGASRPGPDHSATGDRR